MEYNFEYTLNDMDLDAFRNEGIKRLRHLCDKGFDTVLTPEQMYDVLYAANGRILCVISLDGGVVGMMVLHEGFDLLRYKKVLVIELCELDNIPGILDAVEAEIDRICGMDEYDAVQFHFTRRGWLKKMKMHPEKGYKLVMNTAEKSYGRQRSETEDKPAGT